MSTANFWTCPRCDVVNDAAIPTCENCGAARSDRLHARDTPPSPDVSRCARCASASASTAAFHIDGAAEDASIRLCPACWIPALRRRAERDPISTAERHALRTTLAQVIARMTP